jgi:tetratricopeptide (TPR) repeat protein
MPPSETAAPGRPTVFVSYSHRDKHWKDHLVRHLRVLQPEGVLEVWHDPEIGAGEDWQSRIQEAMERASAAVLLVSADFLVSKFILEEEVPYLLGRREADTLRIFPVIARPCAWSRIPWLAELQCRPEDGRPLSRVSEPEAEEALAAFVEEVGRHLSIYKDGATVPRSSTEAPAAPHLDLGRLPTPGPHFVGRTTELARLSRAWKDPGTHVLTFVAFGGVGKTTLVARWLGNLAKGDWKGARRVLDWSFYSQGQEERVTSADRFLDHALGFFGDPDPKAGAARDRGLRLAELVRREKTLLVLDGVEPLQHPPGPLAGKLKDPGLATFLKSLAAGNPGLCVVTTRERIADLEGFRETAPQVDLEALSPEAGAELLRELGVEGRASELRAASVELGNHALAISLMGNYLKRACRGDIRRRKEVDLGNAAERLGGHALRVIRAYAQWLGEGREVAVLRLLGLFDRPAAQEALAALRAAPAIPGLTEALVGLSEEEWEWAVSSLREHGLLLRGDSKEPGVLDAHPLVRVYFQEELEKERPQAWEAGNLRLYEHLQKAAPDLPETLEEMEPLYAAVLHGCRAGRQQEALVEVYGRRIQRGNEFYSTQKLGAIGSELSALSGFFDRPWDQPSARLGAGDQAWVLNEAAFDLRALGRLAEAVAPMQAGLERRIEQKVWKSAAIIASNLSELTLTLGEVGQAVSFGEQSVALADLSGDAFQRVSKRATRADSLHQAGRWEESAEAFREAEALQGERQPEYPRLYGLPGYRYCDLLLSPGEPGSGSGLEGVAGSPEEAERFRQACREVRERAEETLKWAVDHFGHLSIALDHLSLGRAHLDLAVMAGGTEAPGGEAEGDFARAAEHLGHAVEGLRRAGDEEYVGRGLLARAAFHRLRGNLSAAESDLSEAQEIAERGGMRLHLCDAHLEWARLTRAQGKLEEARGHVAVARELVEETGYQRRAREVTWLDEHLASLP